MRRKRGRFEGSWRLCAVLLVACVLRLDANPNILGDTMKDQMNKLSADDAEKLKEAMNGYGNHRDGGQPGYKDDALQAGYQESLGSSLQKRMDKDYDKPVCSKGYAQVFKRGFVVMSMPCAPDSCPTR